MIRRATGGEAPLYLRLSTCNGGDSRWRRPCRRACAAHHGPERGEPSFACTRSEKEGILSLSGR
jgi:hypothetical protein